MKGSADTDQLAVVKVGGSLFDLPELGRHLLSFLERLQFARVLVVPGGGVAADAIRELDRLHGLGEESSHDLALRAMTLNAHFVARVLTDAADRVITSRAAFPVLNPLSDLPHEGITLVDAHAFCLADNGDDALPACWDATSDSIAARVAVTQNAGLLILLKSIDRPRGTWSEAMRQGVIDPLFVRTLSRGRKRIPARPSAELINFREQIRQRTADS